MSSPSVQHFSHLEINTKDIKPLLEYFTDVLGMPLASIDWGDKAKGTVRAFLRLSEQSMVSIIASPDTPEEIDYGTTHSANAADPTNAGTVQHTAFNVDSVDELYEMRDRIRSRGVHCVGPMDHGFCQSIYFVGPDELALEVSTFTVTDLSPWIVDSVADAIGLSKEELQTLQERK